MDKTQELTRAISSLVRVIEQQNKVIENYTRALKENTDMTKELKTRLGSVANAISDGGKIVQK